MPLPDMSPLRLPRVICSACGEEMRVHVRKVGKGMVSGATAYCDTKGCEYGWELQFEYATGVPARYVPLEKKFAIPADAPKFPGGGMLTGAVMEKPNGAEGGNA